MTHKTVFEKAKARALNENRAKQPLAIRVSEETARVLRERSEHAGLTLNELCAAILDEVVEEERIA